MFKQRRVTVYKMSEVCEKCIYRSYDKGWETTCDYLIKVGHSRTIENGKSRGLPKGYCDKFEEK